MYIQEFGKNDLLFNVVQTSPRYEFFLTKEGEFILKNKPVTSNVFSANEIGMNDIMFEPVFITGSSAAGSMLFYSPTLSYMIALL